MIDLCLAPSSDPTSIYRYRDGLVAADLLTVALVELDLFSWLQKEGAKSNQEICQQYQLQERPVDVMLTLLTAMGLLLRAGDQVRITPLAAEHLTSESQWNLAPYFACLKARPVCKDLLQVLRTGKPASWGSIQHEKEWAKAMEEETFANAFTAAMDCRGIYLAQAMAKKLDVTGYSWLLDIAGGSGIYACSLVAHHPHLQAAVLEKSPVDKIARDSIARRGFSSRVEVVSADMFAGIPSGFDVHLYSNVLHDWDKPKVQALLDQSAAALPREGLLLIHDVHINEEKNGPLPAAAYSALLMHATEGKCYSLGEIRDFLGQAGFEKMQYLPTACDRSAILASKK